MSQFHVRSSAWALLAAVATPGCSRPASPAAPAPPVTVAVVRREAVPYLLTANGRVEPLETARVAAQVSGLVTEVTFREGDAVRQGQVLFRIESRPYIAALEEAQAALARDRAQADNASRGLERLRALRPQDYVTQSQVDSQATTASADAATVTSDRAAVVRAQFDLDNTVIRAPISGRSGSLLVRRGNLVAADPTQPLVIINQIDPILVRFTVPEAVLPAVQRARAAGTVLVRVQPGEDNDSSADFGADSGAATPSVPGDPQGTLTFIDNAVDTTTGTVQLKAQVSNPAGQLWPGQFVNVTLQLGTQSDALVVPAKAVQTSQQGPYLFVVQPNGRAASRSITLGRSAGAVVVVERGVAAGERVVTEGQSQLSAGTLVRITGEDSSAQTPRAES